MLELNGRKSSELIAEFLPSSQGIDSLSDFSYLLEAETRASTKLNVF